MVMSARWRPREKLTDQRGHSRREHRAALNDEGHSRPHKDGQVASHPGKGEREIWNAEDKRCVTILLGKAWVGGPAGISTGPRGQGLARG